MKNKFIRILITINGVLLIPVLLTLIFEIVNSNLKKDNNDLYGYQSQSNDKNAGIKDEYKIEFSPVTKIPNSENYMVAKFKFFHNTNNYISANINLPDIVPDNTINIFFLDKNFNTIGKLLKRNGSIKSIYIPTKFNKENEVVNGLKHLSFYIATKDTNKDGKIDLSDQHSLYITDLNGKNLIKVTDKKLKQYKWINNGKEIFLNFELKDKSESAKLKLGIYNVETKTLRIPKTE